MALVRSAVKPRAYRACTFEGLETKGQIYLELVAEGMAKQGFKRADEWGERNLALGGSDAIFKSADEKFLAGIRAVSTEDGNMRVGYALAGMPGKAAKILVFSGGLAFILGVLSAYTLRQVFGPLTTLTFKNLWVLILVLIILFSTFLVPVLAYTLPAKRKLNQEIKQLLIEIGESMGSKQITSFSSYFKLTTVDLEDR